MCLQANDLSFSLSMDTDDELKLAPRLWWLRIPRELRFCMISLKINFLSSNCVHKSLNCYVPYFETPCNYSDCPYLLLQIKAREKLLRWLQSPSSHLQAQLPPPLPSISINFFSAVSQIGKSVTPKAVLDRRSECKGLVTLSSEPCNHTAIGKAPRSNVFIKQCQQVQNLRGVSLFGIFFHTAKFSTTNMQEI